MIGARNFIPRFTKIMRNVPNDTSKIREINIKKGNKPNEKRSESVNIKNLYFIFRLMSIVFEAR